MFPDLTRDDVFRIETKRLWLRWPRVQDAAAIARLAGEKEVAEMTANIPHPFPTGLGERFVFENRKANGTGCGLRLAIAQREKPDRLIGFISINDREGQATLGYWVGKPHWGKGLATEAAHGLIDAVFSYTVIEDLHVSAHVANPASRRIIEKCGFQFAGSDMQLAPARGGRVAVDRFRLPRSTWASLKGWREPRIEIDQRSLPIAEPVMEACT